ncbi:DUF924 family protein [Paracoccus sp. (in: a-proteobacteria)]|uniref:DUF924 family protein n=1 Tax=Paracoccus sp. TaxID=267 RepID=UPI0026DFC0C3|nr:DUF924 family protein [Paracoccus sp. (in: a-proteobacteria)]MDO5647782.1 DUF924 family protein [Paracoccus sp. (in: a-proteobacteria)]
MTASPSHILSFWFSDAVRPFWFARSDDLDRQIADQFSATHSAAHNGDLDHWIDAPDSALALTITLDQFPRNLFRGTARSFDSDARAREHARTALQRGYDLMQPDDRRPFFYLPFMHSEDLADQEKSVALYQALGAETSLTFARDHHDIIARFGRFPHRNAALGRTTTPDEAAFLKTHPGF